MTGCQQMHHAMMPSDISTVLVDVEVYIHDRLSTDASRNEAEGHLYSAGGW